MPRILTLGILAAVVIALVALSEAKSGEPPVASAGPPGNQLIWGDWDCGGVAEAAGPQGPVDSIGPEDFFRIMYTLAGIQLLVTGCPSIGDAVTVALYGTLYWGDINCDSIVDEADALLWMLWYADLLPSNFPDCPDMEDILDLIEDIADFKAQAMSYEIGGPVARAAPQDAEPQLFDVPYEILTAFIIHNNGPDSPVPDIVWNLDLLSGALFFRWMAQAGDICLDEDELPIPCGEGAGVGPASNGADDTCYDGVDNDDDGPTDFEDSDCQEVRSLLTPASAVNPAGVIFPPSVQQQMRRNFNVRCLQAGSYNFNISAVLTLAPGSDPELGNNSTSAIFNQPPCQLIATKGPPRHAPPEHKFPVRAPVPYEPAALPQTGGKP